MENEKRLIDANALKKCTCEWCNTHYSDEPCEPSECIEMLRIDGQPTVDAVEVVRCKDCKHWEVETGFCDEHSQFNHDEMCWDVFNEDDFCSYGERKDK